MSGVYRLEIVIHGLPTCERNARRFWRRAYEEKVRWRRAIEFAVGDHLPPAPLRRARVVLTRHSTRSPDPENLAESWKTIIDAIRIGKQKRGAGLPILVDDKPENYLGGAPEFRWESAAPGRGRVTILVEEESSDGQATDNPDHAA